MKKTITPQSVERMVPGAIVIDSEVPDLFYAFDSDKSRLLVAGKKGYTMLTVHQATALLRELRDILELRGVFTMRVEYNNPTKRTGKAGFKNDL